MQFALNDRGSNNKFLSRDENDSLASALTPSPLSALIIRMQ